ncbi:phage tail terminator protein [Marinobacter salarius]|uniref:phage tail terminator protein n=1 Tax=Marinobacter salarius TaxID=1420917 RepID=UPI0025A3937B|nr:hypothetical protein [Marinobacter salarius]MDM8181258.1 hypothetical protein [Marinobacter salarius]
MLDLVEWVNRISTPEQQAVMAADVDAAQQSRTLPALVVVPGRETVVTAPLSAGAGSRHRIVAEVLVVTAVPRGNQPLGAKMVDELKALREPTLQQLINWLPTGSDIEVTWQGGQLMALKSNALYWVDAFKTDYWWSL